MTQPKRLFRYSKIIPLNLFGFLALISCSLAWGDLLAPNPRITIIIDDLGDNFNVGKTAVDLPGNVTYAILPHTPSGVKLAEHAHKNGKQVILHVPMESHDSNLKLGNGALLASMKHKRYQQILTNALDSIPHVSGLNNHMGSLLTERSEPMTWLMLELKKRDLFFIDSRTSSNSVARKTALRLEVPSLTRDVFLDNDQSIEAIDAAFKKLLDVVKRKGYAIAIGHPYPTTLKYLKDAIPKLEKQGISLINASTMISGPDPSTWKKYASPLKLPSTL